MNATLQRRLRALESALAPAPEPEEGLSEMEKYMRLIAAPLPRRRRLPEGPDMTPEEAYRLLHEGDGS